MAVWTTIHRARPTGRKGNIVNTILLKAAALAAIALTTPLAASANSYPAAASAPVRLNGVQVMPIMGGDRDIAVQRTVISFTNLDPIPAKEVLFFVRDGNGRVIDSYDDYGTFSQGVEIRHTFSALAPDSDPKLNVAEVTFADGSVWFEGQPSPMLRRQAASEQSLSAGFSKELSN